MIGRGAYEARKVFNQLARELARGEHPELGHVPRCQVERLMRVNNLCVCVVATTPVNVVSSPSSKPWDTPSRSNPQPDADTIIFGAAAPHLSASHVTTITGDSHLRVHLGAERGDGEKLIPHPLSGPS